MRRTSSGPLSPIPRSRAEIALQQPRTPRPTSSPCAASRRRLVVQSDSLWCARADAGERQIEKEPIFLDDIAVDAAAAADAVARPKNVAVTDEFEEVPVWSDRTPRTDDVLLREIHHAARSTFGVSMPQGLPTFVVEDTGIGIGRTSWGWFTAGSSEARPRAAEPMARDSGCR